MCVPWLGVACAKARVRAAPLAVSLGLLGGHIFSLLSAELVLLSRAWVLDLFVHL